MIGHNWQKPQIKFNVTFIQKSTIVVVVVAVFAVIVSQWKCVQIIRDTVNLNRLTSICAQSNSLDGLRNVSNGIIVYGTLHISIVSIRYMLWIRPWLVTFCLFKAGFRAWTVSLITKFAYACFVLSVRWSIIHHWHQYFLSVANMHEINILLAIDLM